MSAFTPAPVKPQIDYEVFDRLDIRVGTIVTVNDVPDSRKLLRFEVDFGDHRRQILAGMKKERDDARILVGRQALFVVNLAARRMAGLLSEGMFVDVGFADGLSPALAIPESPVPPGARVG